MHKPPIAKQNSRLPNRPEIQGASLRKILVPLLLFAGTVQAQTRFPVDVYGITVNGIPYTENMILPSVGKDASGNYIMTVKFSLRGVGFGSGEHVFALSDKVCTGNYPNEREADSSPKIVLDDPENCKKFFTWAFIPFGNGVGNFSLSAPDAAGFFTATYAVSPAKAAGSLKLSHQWATMTSASTVPGVTPTTGQISIGCTYTPPAHNVAQTCTSTGKANIFTAAGFGAALPSLPPKYTTTATGTLKSRVVASKIRVDNSNYDQTGHLYVAAYFPSTGQLYFQSNGAWVLWDGASYPAFRENVTLGDNDLGTIVSGYNLRALVGAKLYVGFGKSGAEVVAKSQYSMVHELVMEQADKDEIAAEEAAVAAEIAAQNSKFNSCVTSGCELSVKISEPNSTVTSISVTSAIGSLKFGVFTWAGDKVVWTCSISSNSCPIRSQSVYHYNTATGYWQ